MGNWTVDTDDEKNRLHLSIEGFLEPEEAKAAADATLDAADSLDEGFEMVNDMSEFQPSSDESMKQIKRGKQGVAKRGVAAVVRVTSESTTGQMQWDRAGEDEERYQVAKAGTAEQANKLLDKRGE